LLESKPITKIKINLAYRRSFSISRR